MDGWLLWLLQLLEQVLPQVINKESMRKLCLTVTSVGLCRYSGSWASCCFFIYIVNCFMGLVFRSCLKKFSSSAVWIDRFEFSFGPRLPCQAGRREQRDKQLRRCGVSSKYPCTCYPPYCVVRGPLASMGAQLHSLGPVALVLGQSWPMEVDTPPSPFPRTWRPQPK